MIIIIISAVNHDITISDILQLQWMIIAILTYGVTVTVIDRLCYIHLIKWMVKQ
jgi:hypothetical protein